MPWPLQVGISLLVIIGVVGVMWRLPRASDALLPWAPPLALISAWSGLLGVGFTGLLWLMPQPDPWIAAVFMLLYPLALACGVLVLWIYRDRATSETTISAQRTQAMVGVGLGLAATAMGYWFVFTHKAPSTVLGG